jgi:rod shape-determining protein MreD
MSIRLRIILAGVALFLVQLVFIPFIGVFEFTPDVLIIWLVFVGIRRGHIEATIAGFCAGLLQDSVTTQFFGLAALSKSVVGFLAGYFYNESNVEQALGSYRLLAATAIVSVVHNIIYYTIFFQGREESLLVAIFQLTVGITLYTSMLAILPMFAFSRTYHTQWTQ